MRRNVIVVSLVLVVIVIAGYLAFALRKTDEKHVTQGIKGTVTLHTGNCMPMSISPGEPRPRSTCKSQDVSRTVYIRSQASVREHIKSAYLIKPTRLIAEAKSNSQGYFEVSVPPGKYSVFVEDEDGEYCSRSDGVTACPVEVGSGVTIYDIKIDHASY